jgi:hypothetical protein
MSCISVVPMTMELMKAVLPRLPSNMPGPEINAFQDPRCAIAVYRTAIEMGYAQRTVSLEVVKEISTAQSIAMIKEVSGRRLEDWPALTAAE